MLGKQTTRTGVNIDYIAESLQGSGWREVTAGKYRSAGKSKTYDDRYALFVRSTNFDDFLQKSSKATLKNPVKSRLSGVGSKSPLQDPLQTPTPPPAGGGSGRESALDLVTKPRKNSYVDLVPSDDLPVVYDFARYPSISAARSDKDSLVIAYDSEWFGKPTRTILSWQFACIYDGMLNEFVFLAKDDDDLNLELAVARILDELGFDTVDARKIRRYEVAVDFDEEDGKFELETFDNYHNALECSFKKGYAYLGFSDGIAEYDESIYIPEYEGDDRYAKLHDGREWKFFRRYNDFKDKAVKKIPVTLLCHTGKVDVSALDQTGSFNRDVLSYCMDVQGGLMSQYPQIFAPKSVMQGSSGDNIFPISMDVRDTMGHAPADKKTLKSLGDTLGVPKIELPEEPIKYIEHMDLLLKDDPDLYFAYASNDSVVTLLYGGTVYGYNKSMPLTLTSAAARSMRSYMAEYLGCESDADFDRRYRGKKRVGRGKHKRENTKGGALSEFTDMSSLEPISKKASGIQLAAQEAYFGGYNGCFEYGYFPFTTFDYDIRNAYPTAMCIIPDVDWSDPIAPNGHVWERYLDLREWYMMGGVFNPFRLFFGYIRFEFPEDCLYPTIPIRDEKDGVPIFPQTSEGFEGVYACGPEIFLALQLGAKVYCEEGWFLNPLMRNEDGRLSESRSMAYATIQFVRDRALSDMEHGGDKKNMVSQILKTMINSGYGKIAQSVIEKHRWDAHTKEMLSLGCSSITNAVNASMITSIVRAVLLAAQNELHNLGYKVYSCTTDGFISDAPEDVVKSLDLYGLRPFMEQSRMFITNNVDPELWEIKHVQDDLLNFTTRGNVSRRNKATNPMIYNGKAYDGVCAHNSFKTGFEKDSYEDRDFLMRAVLSRTGAVEYADEEWTTFKELAQGKPFRVRPLTRKIHMDADLKRAIDSESLETINVSLGDEDDDQYEICNFRTRPFKSVNEFYVWRKKKKVANCLRTEKEIRLFLHKVKADPTGVYIADLEWSKLMSCVRGHAKHYWTIPKLNEGTRAEKVAWINTHNHSGKEFTIENLKNCQRQDRKSKILPEKMLRDLLDEMMNDN